MNFYGVLIAAACFLSIGMFHPLVIQAEYHFSKHCWPAFLVLGLILLGLSVFTKNLVAATILGAVGCSALWSILELFEQEKRVRRGWFPENPKRRKREQEKQEKR